jgi:hypothetical protein
MLHTWCYRSVSVSVFPFPKSVQATIDRSADKLADTAADTRAAMVGLAVLGVAALTVALVALVVAVRKD